MNDRLHKAFDAVRAEDELKTKTLAAIYRKTGGYQSQPPRRSRRWTGLAVAMACVLLVLGLGAWGYLTPVSTIYIDVNPSIELGVNRFDHVVSARGCNQDGEELLKGLSLRFLNYAEALDALLADRQVQGYLAEGKDLSIVVDCGDQQREEEMVAAAQACAKGHGQVHCHGRSHGETNAQQEPGSQPDSTSQVVSDVQPTPAETHEAEHAAESEEHGKTNRHGHGHE